MIIIETLQAYYQQYSFNDTTFLRTTERDQEERCPLCSDEW